MYFGEIRPQSSLGWDLFLGVSFVCDELSASLLDLVMGLQSTVEGQTERNYVVLSRSLRLCTLCGV